MRPKTYVDEVERPHGDHMKPTRAHPPIINAPPVLSILAIVIVAAHGLRVLVPSLAGIAFELGAVFPERFWGWLGADLPSQAYPAYVNVIGAALPLVLTAFVHGGWMHVVLNAAMLVGVGKPVRQGLYWAEGGHERAADIALIALVFASVAGGSLAHLLVHYPFGPPAIGASGGVCGLIAAVLLVRQGAQPRLLDPQFLTVAAFFVAANAVLALIGPSMLGTDIAWQAHIGGFVAGALVARWMFRQR